VSLKSKGNIKLKIVVLLIDTCTKNNIIILIEQIEYCIKFEAKFSRVYFILLFIINISCSEEETELKVFLSDTDLIIFPNHLMKIYFNLKYSTEMFKNTYLKYLERLLEYIITENSDFLHYLKFLQLKIVGMLNSKIQLINLLLKIYILYLKQILIFMNNIYYQMSLTVNIVFMMFPSLLCNSNRNTQVPTKRITKCYCESILLKRIHNIVKNAHKKKFFNLLLIIFLVQLKMMMILYNVYY
uniref:Uncharacterized protein n=1 Tax=Strongyloides stercoralis TaxID=6248 RepID=A0AAF5DP03_STRER